MPVIARRYRVYVHEQPKKGRQEDILLSSEPQGGGGGGLSMMAQKLKAPPRRGRSQGATCTSPLSLSHRAGNRSLSHRGQMSERSR